MSDRTTRGGKINAGDARFRRRINAATGVVSKKVNADAVNIGAREAEKLSVRFVISNCFSRRQVLPASASKELLTDEV